MTTPETAMPTKPRLLVVDDEPSILKLVQTLLSRANYDVVTAPSGTEGLKLLEESFFDCVITDAIMPVMTGYDLVRAIRNHPKHSALPVLMLTRKRHRQDVKHAVEVGVSDYVLKPIDESLLLDKVEFCVKKGGGRRHVFELTLMGDEAHAMAQMACQIRSLSETGITLFVPLMLTDEHTCAYRIPVFVQMGIESPLMKLVSCQPSPMAPELKLLPYEAKYSFIGMAEEDLRKIRAWMQRESVRRRK